jgi:GalNAc-alpha-(1->4)-GalNAc-alpha-(1->3)-diNAcBac-PP-undecaprenol alpha-1,4-N-acetyl-D-galactosaminyltransferase
MPQRRLLLLLTDLKIGGTPTVVRELAKRLHHPPETILSVACLDSRGPVADQIEANGISVTPLNATGTTDFAIIRRLIDLIRVQQVDTVFSFLLHANAVAAAASRKLPGIDFLQSIQTTQPRPRWHWWVQRFAQRRARQIIVPSPSAAIVGQQLAGIPASKITVIPNAIDLPAAMPSRKLSQPPYRVVFLGRLDPVKRIPDLINAIPLLNGLARLDIHLDIYGEGQQRPALEQQIASLGLSEKITLHGSVPSPKDALADADVLVLPSEAEGFGLVLIEAMAAGVPVVATDAPGIRDVVRHNITGLLVPIGQPRDLADAIRKMLSDQHLRTRLTTAAWNDVSQRFTWATTLPAYHRLLRL